MGSKAADPEPDPKMGPSKWVDLSAQSLLDAVPDAILVVSRAGEIVVANVQAEKFFGYDREELIGRSVESLIPPRLRAEHPQRRENFFDDPRVRPMGMGLQLFALRKDATEVPVDINLSPLTNGAGTFVVSAVRDATDRRRTEGLKMLDAVLRETRESEERFGLIADAAPALIWMSGTDKLCTYFNKPWLDFSGRSLEQELGNGWAEGVHPEDLQRCLDTYIQSFDRREKFRMEYRLRRHDGEYRWVLDIGVPRFNEDGSFAGYIGIGVDVTERRRAEGDHSRSAAIVESSDDAIIGTDVSGTVTDWNRGAERLFGYLASEAIGKNIPFLRTADRAKEGKSNLKKAINGDVVKPYETVLQRKDGTPVDVSLRISPIVDVEGRIVGASGIARDITERKRAEDGLRESEGRYRDLAEQSRTTHWEVDLQGLFTYVSHVSEASWGYRPDEVVGRMHFYDLHPEEGREAFKAAVFAFVERKQPFRDVVHAVETKDGRIAWGSLNGIPLPNADGTLRGYRGSCTDITERKQAEEALQKSEERFSKTFRESPIAFTLTSVKDHRYLDANETFEQITGWRRDEVIGRTPFDLGIWVDSTQRLEFAKRVLAEGAVRDGEVHYRCKDGTQGVGLGAAVLIQIGNESCILSAIADITERKRAEVALANVSRKLIEAQEQERIRIARELHDDIGQRLALLAVELQQLHENSLILPEGRGRMNELQKQVSEIAADIQSLSHELHSAKLQYLGIAVAMRGFCREFAEQQKVEIDFQTHDLPSPLSPDISLCFFRVLQEALHNSAKHSGVLHFEVRLWATPDEIHLTVRDSGAGFDREAAKTSQGLGLISMEERLKLVNGTLTIESQPKRGTTVHARVPLSA